MDRDKAKGSVKRGPNKVKATLFPSGDFIALGSKASRTLEPSESKSGGKQPLPTSGSGTERKREGGSSSSSSTSLPTKKPKISAAAVGSQSSWAPSHVKQEVKSNDQWDAVAIEVEPSELVAKIIDAEEVNDDERVECMLCGAVKQLRAGRAKPEPVLFLSLMLLAKTRPLLFCTELVVEAFCSLLRRDISVNFKTKGNNLVSILAANILLAAYHDESSWPEAFVKVYVDDSLGERVWVDHDDCRGFVDNIVTAFHTKIPPKSMMAADFAFKPDACPSPSAVSADDDEASSSSFPLECSENQENVIVLPRYGHSGDNIEQYVMEVIRDQLTRRQPMEVSRNMLRLLVSACGISDVRLLVAQRLEMWLQNPKLTRPAQDLLLAICMNCSQHNQLDVEVISLLIRIRLKTKPVVNHFLQCMKELLNQHTENLSTVVKHVIYNELSNTRNPNNMQLLSIIFQHSPEKAEKILAEVFQDLLINRDDYLRAIRALFREIVRTLRHDLNYSAFCQGLMQERRESAFRDLEQQFKERLFSSITDIITLTIFLAIGPSVREAASGYSRADKKDIAVLRNYQMQVAMIQRDAVWWLHTVVPKMYKPGRNEYVQCLHKVLFRDQADQYYNKDNWPPEGDRMLMIRLASEVPVLEDTLMRILIIGLSKEHPVNASDALELADQLVKRAAALHMDDYSILQVERLELFDVVFNLCAYHHPENLVLPQGYQPPSLAIADLYWKAWTLLLIVVAHNPCSFGQSAWDNYPTLRSLMEMCITNHFTFPPPTMALGEKADEMNARELQISQLEKQEILQFESHLAAASTKLTITEANSLLLSKLITMDPLGVVRKPPPVILEQLMPLNQTLKLGHLLCRSRNPDFLLDIIQRQGTSQSMPWLAELVESSDGSFSMLPVQCLCEFLLNDTQDNNSGWQENTLDDSRDDKSDKQKNKKKHKQQQLLQHLQMLIHEPGDNPLPTCEVLDYFMRRLSSQQPSARLLAAKSLSLVLCSPNKSPGSDDEDMIVKGSEGEHSWLLRHIPHLPHFDAVRSPASLTLRQACQVENDPSAVSAYVQFLSFYAPDTNLQDIADLALNMARLIVERPTIVNCILPSDSTSGGSGSAFLIAISEIFTKYLRMAKKPSKEAYSWSESQDHILVQWASGEAATMHILVVHAMVILLTYGAPEVDCRYFDELLETWFPMDSDPPQAFLVDTSEEALLFPDWLKLRMIRSSVEVLVDAALKDLDPSQLVLFIQSFGIPVSSMTKLLRTLDMAVEYDSCAVEQVVVDKSYMSQLVEVQHQRGATGGEKFFRLLGREDTPELGTESEPTPTQMRVIQRAPPKPTRIDSVLSAMTRLFGLNPMQGLLTPRQKQEMFRALQKSISQDIIQKVADKGPLLEFLVACEQILSSEHNHIFVHSLHRNSSLSCVLFRLSTAALAKHDPSTHLHAAKLLWVCQQIEFLSSGLRSPLTGIIRQHISKFRVSSPLEGNMKWWQAILNRAKVAGISLNTDIIMKVIQQVEEEDPMHLEEAICRLVELGVQKGDTKQLTAALTHIMVDNLLTSPSGPSKQQSRKFSLLVDWLEQMEPDLISSFPELQKQLLFFKSCGCDSKPSTVGTAASKQVPVPFRPYLLALLTHQAGWDTLHHCVHLLLSPGQQRYDPSAVLDFLWACLCTPKLWQGRDKKTPKHYTTEDVLALTSAQLVSVVDYILQETVEETKPRGLPESSSDSKDLNVIIAARMPLLMQCCCNQPPLMMSAIHHLLDIICTKQPSLTTAVSSSSHMAQQLLFQMYMHIPSLVSDIVPFSSILSQLQTSLKSYSKLDIISHTLLTCLAATDSSKHCSERMVDLDLACRKMASHHPILFLRQLQMLATLLRGRVQLDFVVFRARNHFALFTYVLGLLELLPPYLFGAEYKAGLVDILDSYVEMFQNYAGQNREVKFLLNRFLLLLHQYVAANPQAACGVIRKYWTSLQGLSDVYPDMASLKSLLANSFLAQEKAGSSAADSSTSAVPTGPLASVIETPSWNQNTLAPLASQLAQEDNPEEILSALQDLQGVSNKIPNVLQHFVDDLKRLIQHESGDCRSAAYALAMQHLKNNPRSCRQFLSGYLQCLESGSRDVVTSALDHLPEFVMLSQEYASLLLQKAFLVGITSNINTAPQIGETFVLLNMQSGS